MEDKISNVEQAMAVNKSTITHSVLPDKIGDSVEGKTEVSTVKIPANGIGEDISNEQQLKSESTTVKKSSITYSFSSGRIDEDLSNEEQLQRELMKTKRAPEAVSSCHSASTGDNHEPFQPFHTLSKFIDSIPLQTNKDDDSVPPLVTQNSRYKKMAEDLSAEVAKIPHCFSKPLKFFWNDDITIAKIDGVEVKLGAGRLGKVFLGYNKQKEWLALKYFNLLKRENHNELADTLKEAMLQDKLAQQGAAPEVQGFGFVMNDTRFYKVILITSFLSAKSNSLKSLTLGALFTEDAARRRNGYPPLLLTHQYLDLFVELAMVMVALSRCQIIHTDIKCDNILVQINPSGQHLVPYLIDFGSGRQYGDSKRIAFKIDTRKDAEMFLKRHKQVAPEFVLEPDAISNKSDLYGMGLILRYAASFLEIPALMCLASTLRLRDPTYRPDCTSLTNLLCNAFGREQKTVKHLIKPKGWSIKSVTNFCGVKRGQSGKEDINKGCNCGDKNSNIHLECSSRETGSLEQTQNTSTAASNGDGASDKKKSDLETHRISHLAIELCTSDSWKSLVYVKAKLS